MFIIKVLSICLLFINKYFILNRLSMYGVLDMRKKNNIFYLQIVIFYYNHYLILFVKSWIVECAELFLETKNNFRDILPTQGIKPSKYQIQKFFDCVAATMSRQLRQIVFKSLKHFMGKIHEYKVCDF